MTFAIVNVLPLPVTPRRVCRPPFRTPLTSCSIASGWSPLGGKASFARVNPVELVSKVLEHHFRNRLIWLMPRTPADLLIIHLRPRNVSACIPTRLNQQSVRYYKQQLQISITERPK